MHGSATDDSEGAALLSEVRREYLTMMDGVLHKAEYRIEL